MTTRTQLIALVIAIVLIGLAVFYFRSPSGKQPLATILYACSEGKTITAVYYAGDTKPAATADLPPVPSGKVVLMLSDDRTMTLPQTLYADGSRYATADESFVFWDKGTRVVVLENNQEKSFVNCIRVAAEPEGSALSQVYVNNEAGVSIRLPDGYTAMPYQYQGMGQGKEISGVKFTVSPDTAIGTNLASDTYVSLEAVPKPATCSAPLFLKEGKEVLVSEGDVTYSVASSTGAAAGNRYEETVYALPGTNPCIAVRYLIHYGVIENYPAGTVEEFDKAALLAQFDAIRRTLVVVR
jgi:membrane-bound inhibitor of C-type lysozyme